MSSIGDEVKEESPETQILPYDDLNSQQRRLTDETFPDTLLEICDSCHWCATCLNGKRAQETCPLCRTSTSAIPMTIDEACILESSEARSITVRFTRRLPLR
jgi:hypothetical protein